MYGHGDYLRERDACTAVDYLIGARYLQEVSRNGKVLLVPNMDLLKERGLV